MQIKKECDREDN